MMSWLQPTELAPVSPLIDDAVTSGCLCWRARGSRMDLGLFFRMCASSRQPYLPTPNTSGCSCRASGKRRRGVNDTCAKIPPEPVFNLFPPFDSQVAQFRFPERLALLSSVFQAVCRPIVSHLEGVTTNSTNITEIQAQRRQLSADSAKHRRQL